jgi:hypothetical protein
VGSVRNGTGGLRTLVEDYAARCPAGKVALLGYSQGAQAVADVLCGASSAGFPPSANLGDKYNSNSEFFLLLYSCLLPNHTHLHRPSSLPLPHIPLSATKYRHTMHVRMRKVRLHSIEASEPPDPTLDRTTGHPHSISRFHSDTM